MSRRPSVAVYAIMRNESRHVAQWAETAADADQLVIVDTGSIDDTFSLARTCVEAADVHQAFFNPFRFDDARNVALSHVDPRIDLCLMLDADETLSPGWRDAIDEAYDVRIGRYRYTLANGSVGTAGTWLSIPRANLHARHGYRWVWPIHEALEGPATEAPVEFTVTHTPDPTKTRVDYLPMLAAACAQRPDSSRMAFYHARELWYRGQYRACRDEMSRYLTLDGMAHERSEGWRILAAIDDFPERWLWHAVAESPERREPWCDLARHYLRINEPDKAALAVGMAERRTRTDIYITDAACWGPAFDDLVAAVAA